MNEKQKITAAKTLATKYGFTQCEVTGKEDELTDEEWKEHRTKGIGGSDTAGVGGLSKWSTPLTLWREKTGKVEMKEEEENERLRIGKDIEPFLRSEALIRLKKHDPEAKVAQCKYMLANHKAGYPAYANLDGVAFFRGEWGILELKTVSEYAAGDWKEGTPAKYRVPDYYEAQGQHYMFVTGAKFVIIVAMIGFSIKTFVIPFKPELVAAQNTRCANFWNTNVVGGQMPTPVSAMDYKVMDEELAAQEEYPEQIDLEDDLFLSELFTEFDTHRTLVKQHEDLKKVTGAKIKDYLMKKNACKIIKEGAKALGMSRVKGRATLDKKKFQAEFPEAFAAYESCLKNGKPSYQLR